MSEDIERASDLLSALKSATKGMREANMSEGFDCQESSNLKWARYDRATQTMEIDFKNKLGEKVSTYAYDNFSPEAWEAFQKARSRGQHFAYVIRPKYKGRKL